MAKRVEEILGQRALEAFKNRVFPDREYLMLGNPEILTFLGAAPQQKEQLAKIREQRERELQSHEQKFNEQSLSVLGPQQQKKLRAEPQRREDAAKEGDSDSSSPGVVFSDPDESGPPDRFEDTPVTVPAYGELTRGKTRKQLRFSAAQEQRWQEMVAASPWQLRTGESTTGGLGRRTDRQSVLHFDGSPIRPTPAIDSPIPMRSEFRRQVEELLTPQQAAALGEIRFHDAVSALRSDSELGLMLGITAEQEARLRRLSVQRQQSDSSTERAARENSLAVPTEAQQQKLRAELDRRGAW